MCYIHVPAPQKDYKRYIVLQTYMKTKKGKRSRDGRSGAEREGKEDFLKRY